MRRPRLPRSAIGGEDVLFGAGLALFETGLYLWLGIAAVFIVGGAIAIMMAVWLSVTNGERSGEPAAAQPEQRG